MRVTRRSLVPVLPAAGAAVAAAMTGCGNSSGGAPNAPQAAAPASAAAPARPLSTPTLTLDARRVVYQLPGMEAAAVRRDLAYRQVAGAALELDVYTPSGPGQPRPAVLFVHGFPVPPGSKIRSSGQYVSWSQLVAATGLAGVPLDWRGDLAELRDAIEYVRQHAADLGINPDRLALFGFSAGGGPMLAELLREPPPSMRCAVVYYGNLMPGTAALASAAAERVPPLLLVRAGRDTIMPAPAFDQFVAESSAKGARAETLVHPTGMHAFDMLNDDDTSRDIIKQTLTFLATHLTA